MEVLNANVVVLANSYAFLAPVWMVAVGVAMAVMALYGIYGLLLTLAPKVAAIARTAAKEAYSQGLFWVLLALGTVLIVLLSVVPYNTFGDDIKMFKEQGLTLILVLSVFQAVWSASVSIADELEGRTALTLLSKPVGRRQFLLGKFFGVLGPVFVMFIVLGAVFLVTTSYKLKYDAREMSLPAPTVLEHQAEMLQIVPGLALAFLETTVLTSIAVAISTRLPMLPNLLISVTIYVVGHLVPLLVQSAVGKFAVVTFMGQFLATVLPVLEFFNIQAAVAVGRDVPLSYVGWAALYALAYNTVALLLALLLFEDRDLA